LKYRGVAGTVRYPFAFPLIGFNLIKTGSLDPNADNPFGTTVDPNTFVSGPPTADEHGNIYYSVNSARRE
jgi:hypothetical protein